MLRRLGMMRSRSCYRKMLAPVLHRSYIRLAPFAGLKRPVLQRQHLLAIRRVASKVALPEPYDIMTLLDGRTLAWAEAGDPSDDPLFLFHGWPGSRLAVFVFENVDRRFLSTYLPYLTAWIQEQVMGSIVRGTLNESGSEEWDEMMALRDKREVHRGEAVADFPPEQMTPKAIAARREWELRRYAEPMAQGARGLVHDYSIITHPWGFRLEEVRYEPQVQIFHGAKDENVPLSMVRYMRGRIGI